MFNFDKTQIPYDELDKNIVELVRFLNSFDGVFTVGSCGGHTDPKPGQTPANEWLVIFKLEFIDGQVSLGGWLALEFLTWAINNDLRRGGFDVRLMSFSAPPYLNEPGQTINFGIEGRSVDPAKIVQCLVKFRNAFFISAAGKIVPMPEFEKY